MVTVSRLNSIITLEVLFRYSHPGVSASISSKSITTAWADLTDGLK